MAHPTDANDQNVANPVGLCARAVTEAWDFCIQTALHLDKRARQAEVISHGLVVGGIKDTPNELLNHGWQTAGKAAMASAIGAGISIAIDSKIKWLAFGAKSIGLALGGTAIASTAIELSSKRSLQSALSNVWNSSDPRFVQAGKSIAEIECGPEGFNWLLTLPSAALGAVGGKTTMKWLNNKCSKPMEIQPAPLTQGRFPEPLQTEIVSELLNCNKAEQSALIELHQYLQTELPGSSIRWVRREPSCPNSINMLVDLPADVSIFAPEVFQMRLFLETLNDEHNCDIGLRTVLEKRNSGAEFGSILNIDFLNIKPAR